LGNTDNTTGTWRFLLERIASMCLVSGGKAGQSQ